MTVSLMLETPVCRGDSEPEGEVLFKRISARSLAVCRLNSPLESVELGKDVRGILGYLHFLLSTHMILIQWCKYYSYSYSHACQ